ncbi:POK6 protein, partial [Sterrhoptilus dennistouni]|nr:POK6 protein [Sterrhoptilus dennistouni]
RKRYHWKVLPQGMKNSPVICQWYVSSLLTPVRAAEHQAIIHHYMDDVLVCAPSDDLLTHALDLTVNTLVAAGFELQEQKIQRMPPWKYLGLQIDKRTIIPQRLAIKTNVEMLADAHQLCGALNWVRPWLGLTTEDLAPLFNLLRGGEGLSSPRSLTPEAEKALEKVQRLMSTRQASRCDPDLPFRFVILGNLPHLHGLIFQWDIQVTSLPRKDRGKRDPLLIIEWVFLSHQRPLEALTVFTDASGGSHKSVMTWKDPQTQRWESDVAEVEGSPQIAELDAVVRAFERFPEPLNIVTDSAYVAGVVSRAENSILQEVTNATLFGLLSRLVRLISHREHPFYVMHVRSHTDLPGFIAEGNRRADALAAPVAMAPLPDVFQQAKMSHQLFHQNAPGLVRQFHLSRDQAKAIVATCPSCQRHAVPTMHAGVNPRGLHSNEIWQMDITHIAEFGRLKYVHVSVDTFSGIVFASAHTGEKAVDVMKHLIQAFSFMGIPKMIKTDNGASYVSRELGAFLQQWGVEHRTGIPYSPTGQAIVERTHQNLKRVLAQQ